MKKSAVFLFCLLFFNSETFFAQTPAALSAFLKKKNLSHAAVSFKAVDLSTKKTIASCNENMSLTPASSLKIVSTATALDYLGENFCFETPLCCDGFIRKSTLYGNLYIKGSGDPSLGSEFMPDDKERFLNEWLTAVKDAGIERISGRIIVLDQLFGYEGVSPKWLWEDMGTYYAPGVYGISVFDNMYRIYLQSFAPGDETSILYTDPLINHLQLRNEVKASDDLPDETAVFGLPFSNEMRLYGTIPANKSSFVVKGAIPDPGLFLANYFHDYLQKNGILIEGQPTTYRLHPVTPDKEKELGVVRSADLASIIQGVNVRSDNQYAEHIYKVLTVLDSVDISNYWEEKGLDSSALFMVDGSGVSPKNALSSGFLIDLLIYMNERSGKSTVFRQSLPVAGKEGTVASFLKNTPLNGKARLKSGSMSNVQSYSGYIESKGKRYAVALIVNNFTGKRADLRKEIEQLFVKLF
jgi:D-alanyl-D-alanine carboxypeptidase/D-alanyl-D-alanine-endopeptidase (penicillin-binding protein 4)